MDQIVIRRATAADCGRLLELVQELADYEKAPDEVTVTLDHFIDSGFGLNPVWWAFVAASPNPSGGGGEASPNPSKGGALRSTFDGDIQSNEGQNPPLEGREAASPCPSEGGALRSTSIEDLQRNEGQNPPLEGREAASPNPSKGGALRSTFDGDIQSNEGQNPPLEGRSEPSPNPSKGGALRSTFDGDIQSNEGQNPPLEGREAQKSRIYNYQTANPISYGILKEFVKTNRANQTIAETIVWELLRGKQLNGYKFRRQHIIGSYIADFVCLSKQLIIEIDGLIHQIPENYLNDIERTQELNNLGFKVIRFSNEEVLKNRNVVVNSILEAIEHQNLTMDLASPNPSKGGALRSTSIGDLQSNEGQNPSFDGGLQSVEGENPPLEGREAASPNPSKGGALSSTFIEDLQSNEGQNPPFDGGLQSIESQNPPLEGREAAFPNPSEGGALRSTSIEDLQRNEGQNPHLEGREAKELIHGFALYYIRYSTWKGQRMY